MNIIRFEPWSIARLIDRDFDTASMHRRRGADADAAHWNPAVDIVEYNDGFALRADVPGVDAGDIDVSMDAGVLSISGERRAEERGNPDGVHRHERFTGRFVRRFTLPATADADGIKARCTNGILEIDIPKLPDVQARRIAIDAA